MLINCPECKKQVSDTAAACPHCGAPIADALGSKAPSAPLTTVQETGKRLKVHILISACLFWGGSTWLFSDAANAVSPTDQSPFPVIFLFAGAIWYGITKIRVWWHHK